MKYLDWIFQNQPTIVFKLATGEVKLPLSLDVQPFTGAGFQPAFVPIWYRSGMSYFGLWKHWFCDRDTVFVRVVPEFGYEAIEVARSIDQLVGAMAFEAICSFEGVVPKIARFAVQCGLEESELEVMDQISLEFGDLPENLLRLPRFQNDAPLRCFPQGVGYTGQFPSQTSAITETALQRICSLEIPSDARKRFAGLPSRPRWLEDGPKATTFEFLLDSGDLSGAWLCLNSRGWKFGEIRKALPRLVSKSDDHEFAELAECWLALDHGDEWGY